MTFVGTTNLDRLAEIPDDRHRQAIERGLDLGLTAADSVQDRSISTFARGYQPAFAGINTFLKAPYLEDVKQVGGHDVAIVGAPFDMGTTFRPGARWAPQAVRRISALYDGYILDADPQHPPGQPGADRHRRLGGEEGGHGGRP